MNVWECCCWIIVALLIYEISLTKCILYRIPLRMPINLFCIYQTDLACYYFIMLVSDRVIQPLHLVQRLVVHLPDNPFWSFLSICAQYFYTFKLDIPYVCTCMIHHIVSFVPYLDVLYLDVFQLLNNCSWAFQHVHNHGNETARSPRFVWHCQIGRCFDAQHWKRRLDFDVLIGSWLYSCSRLIFLVSETHNSKCAASIASPRIGAKSGLAAFSPHGTIGKKHDMKQEYDTKKITKYDSLGIIAVIFMH